MKKTVILVSFCILCILIGSELVLRAKAVNDLKQQQGKRYKDWGYCNQSYPGLIYRGIPHKCGHNSQGFMGKEHNFKKPERVFRIILIGDSVAGGQGGDFDKSFGKLLERKLNNLSGGIEYEIIVLAESGYSTSQELILLKKTALKYSPDLLIWSYCLNDPAPPISRGADGGLRENFYKPKIYLKHFISRKLVYFSENVKKKLRGCSDEYEEFLHCVYWEKVEENMAEIAKITNTNNIPVIFLIHPIFPKNKTFSNYQLVSLHDNLRKLASEKRFLVIDLLDVFKSYEWTSAIESEDDLWLDRWHPSKKGHAIIADSVYYTIYWFLKDSNY